MSRLLCSAAGVFLLGVSVSVSAQPLCQAEVDPSTPGAGAAAPGHAPRLYHAQRSRAAAPALARVTPSPHEDAPSPDPLGDAIARGQGVDVATLTAGHCAAGARRALDTLREPTPAAMHVNNEPAVGLSAPSGRPELTLVASNAVRAHVKLKSSGAKVDVDVAMFHP